MVVTAILGILAYIAIPHVQAAIQEARYGRAIADIKTIHNQIELFRSEHHGGVPIDWEHFHEGTVPIDPWGNPYKYNSFHDDSVLGLSLDPVLPPGISNGLDLTLARRRSGSLAPINSNYDLFSTGPDHLWQPLLIMDVSKDDAILANDGGFIGKASDY